MIRKKNDGIEYLTFASLNEVDFIRHAFSTRIGGVSTGIFSSMNLGYTRGDDKACVDENFRRMAALLKCETGDFVTGHQTHTVNVRLITEADKGKGVIRPVDYHDTDGLITNVPGIVLVTF